MSRVDFVFPVVWSVLVVMFVYAVQVAPWLVPQNLYANTGWTFSQLVAVVWFVPMCLFGLAKLVVH